MGTGFLGIRLLGAIQVGFGYGSVQISFTKVYDQNVLGVWRRWEGVQFPEKSMGFCPVECRNDGN